MRELEKSILLLFIHTAVSYILHPPPFIDTIALSPNRFSVEENPEKYLILEFFPLAYRLLFLKGTVSVIFS